jgi:hypothetical protein
VLWSKHVTQFFIKNCFNRAFGLPREGETRREDGQRLRNTDYSLKIKAGEASIYFNSKL